MVITRVFKNGGGRKAEVSEEEVAMEEKVQKDAVLLTLMMKDEGHKPKTVGRLQKPRWVRKHILPYSLQKGMWARQYLDLTQEDLCATSVL